MHRRAVPRRRHVLLAFVALSALASSCTAAAPTWEEQMLRSVNEQRAAVGSPPVSWCPRLGVAARAHSADQAGMGKMTHTGSDGSDPTLRAERAGYRDWSALAENVAAGQPDVGSVMAAWMASKPHRDNLRSTAYTHAGFGQALRGSTIYWTQVFGRGGTC